MKDDDLLTIIETDYRSSHMYWIEKRLNKGLENWFRKTDEIEVEDWLAKQQINYVQVDAFDFNKESNFRPVKRLSLEAYQS